jgi:K+-transporting ATPase ATPase A chain
MSSSVPAVVLLVVALAATCPLLGWWIADALMPMPGEAARGDRIFRPFECVVYRLLGVSGTRSMRWAPYARAVLVFGAVSTVGLFAILRLQGQLPLNPTDVDGQSTALAFNTAVSFVTGTNWQAYAGETGASHLAQIAGLVTAHFTAAAVGIAVGLAVIRSLVRTSATGEIGSFWVDVVRSLTRLLVPMALLFVPIVVSQGAVQDLRGFERVTTIEGNEQLLPHGPAASQEITKSLGTNGGGLFNAGSAHPLAVPNGLVAVIELYLSLAIPFAFPFAFARAAKHSGFAHQGRVIVAVMAVALVSLTGGAMLSESAGNDDVQAGIEQSASEDNPGGYLEGKEVRLGAATSALTTVGTMGTTTGLTTMAVGPATNAGSGLSLVSMALGEVTPGGVGTGMVGMLIMVLVTIFIAGLMVGRTPEYLGKSIGSREVRFAILATIVVPLTVLAGAAASVAVPTARSAATDSGAHGLTEIVYAFVSATNANGSAMAGLASNTQWYNTTLALAMLVGRFAVIVFALALAGCFTSRVPRPVTAATLPTTGLTFGALLGATLLLLTLLTYLPVFALGPLASAL